MNLPQRMSHAEALGCQILLEGQLFAASCDRQRIDRQNSRRCERYGLRWMRASAPSITATSAVGAENDIALALFLFQLAKS
ncbi:hypothetical protein XHC_4109 [Xanthomonas hortorum pv. carotae str. M081]|nr:hypothetical protein XHC_4109 [Xanthomonas hortorum pv. carotae str. M081]